MRNQQVLKLFLVLVVCVTYIFSFSHFGALAYDSVMNRNDKFSEGTMIGSVSIAEKSQNEAMQLLDEKLTSWLNGTTITLKYKEKSENLDLGMFTFDIENTISQAKHGIQNSVHVIIQPIDDLIMTISSTLTSDVINIEALENELLRSASMLQSGTIEISLEQFLLDESLNQPEIVSESTIQSEFVEKEMEQFVGKSIEIAPMTQFSLLNYVEEELSEVSALTLSKIATSIYESILPTNFSIIERHISNELPEYATLGYEAKVDIRLKNDLVFSNPNETSYYLEFERVNDSIVVSLLGTKFLNRYNVTPSEQETFRPKIIRQFNPQLGPTEIKVKVEGKDGQLVKVYREHLGEMGELIKKELISEDFYPPVHQVEVQGLIIKEGNSTITPEEDGDILDNSENTESTDGKKDEPKADSENPSENVSDLPDSNIDEDLWGKENEIPK